jgi:2-dehydropantoate 2-reductase
MRYYLERMSDEKPTRYVVFGAGAIGCVIAGLLNRAGSRVVCVARPAYAKALTDGIVIKENNEESTVRSDAVTSVNDLTPEPRDIAMITTKSQATESAVEDLYHWYGEKLRVVCLQNGVRNEVIAARRFEQIYAGLVFFSAVQLEPSVITLPQGRTIAIGCYPDGLDTTAHRISDDLKQAGFDAIASPHVMSMKWGKLVANLNNAVCAITGFWLEQAMADPETRRLMVEVREEGLRVLDAAGIDVEPPESEPSPIRIREMTKKLKQPPKHQEDFKDLPEAQRTYASTWQDLRIGRKTGEAHFLNGEIVALGEKLGIATPYNSTLLKTIDRMFEERLAPGLYSPRELRQLIAGSR